MSTETPRGGGGLPIALDGGANKQPDDSALPKYDVRTKDERSIIDAQERKRIILEIQSLSGVRRKEEHKKRAAVYRDGTKQYALRALKSELEGDTYLEMAARTPNVSIVKKIINKKARVYLAAPGRPLEMDKNTDATKKAPIKNAPKAPEQADAKVQPVAPEQVALDALAKKVRLNGFMKQANRWLELHRNTLVSVLPAPSMEEPGKWTINLDLYNPELYDVIADQQTGKFPVAIIFSYFTQAQPDVGTPNYRTTSGTMTDTAGPSQDKQSQKRQQHFVWWSRTYHFTTNDKGEIIEQPEEKIDGVGANPLGRLPFVSLNKDQANSFWSEGGEDLTDNGILINVLMADMNYIAKFQGMGIIVATGKNLPKSIPIGPNKIVLLEHDNPDDPAPTLQVANANPPVDMHIKLIEQLLAFTLSTNDLEPGTVSGKLDGAKMANSGIQEIIQQSEISTSIEDEQEIFREKEPGILQLVAAWMQLYGKQNLLDESLQEIAADLPDPEDIKYVLTFDPPQSYVTENDKITTITLKKTSGLFTLRELVAETHPQLDEDGLTAKIAELQADKLAAAELAANAAPVIAKTGPLPADPAKPAPNPPAPTPAPTPKP